MGFAGFVVFASVVIAGTVAYIFAVLIELKQERDSRDGKASFQTEEGRGHQDCQQHHSDG